MRGGIETQARHATVFGRGKHQDSPYTAAIDALDEVLDQKRREVALDAAPMKLPDITLSIAQVARR